MTIHIDNWMESMDKLLKFLKCFKLKFFMCSNKKIPESRNKSEKMYMEKTREHFLIDCLTPYPS